MARHDLGEADAEAEAGLNRVAPRATRAGPARVEPISGRSLSLTLLMLWVGTDYHYLSFSPNQTAINTNFFYRRADFHIFLMNTLCDHGQEWPPPLVTLHHPLFSPRGSRSEQSEDTFGWSEALPSRTPWKILSSVEGSGPFGEARPVLLLYCRATQESSPLSGGRPFLPIPMHDSTSRKIIRA